MCSVFQGDPDFRFPEIFSRPFQSAASFFLQIFIFSSGTLFLRQSPTSILSQLALKSFENNWSTSDFMHSKWALSKRFSWPLHCMFFLFKLMLMLLKMIIFSQPHFAWHLFLIYSPLCSWQSNILSYFQWHLFRHFFLQPCSSIYSITCWHVLHNHERARSDRFLMSLISFLILIMRAWHQD